MEALAVEVIRSRPGVPRSREDAAAHAGAARGEADGEEEERAGDAPEVPSHRS
jgi:hypothetical protein